jgi:hypothetical protein
MSARVDQARARPLGLRPEVELESQHLRALSAIEAFDLSPVWQRLVRTSDMPPRWAAAAVFEFRRYLGLRAVFNRPIAMLSEDIDEVWHTCIIFTRLYAELCERAFGGFLHHDPATEAEVDPHRDWQDFEAAYTHLFGAPGWLWQLSAPPSKQSDADVAVGPLPPARFLSRDCALLD